MCREIPQFCEILERIRKSNIEWPYISRVVRIYFMYRPMLNYMLGLLVVHLHVRTESIMSMSLCVCMSVSPNNV